MPGTISRFVGSIRRKPATAPDGKSDQDEAVMNGDAGKKTSLSHDLTHMGFKNVKLVLDGLVGLAKGEPMNDKDLLLEHGVSMLQSMPNSTLGPAVSSAFVAMLYNDLPHPPATLAGPSGRYRKNDGSGNNIWWPEMGKAGSSYSRSVPPVKTKPTNLPDPELVYDQLLRRKGTFRPHPSGLNRLFFSFATVVIHECFQTSRTNPWINETSSYVDLSTLYGNTEKEQKRVRTYSNGLIFPDSVASDRIMMMPPGVVAVLLMFSRNHNSIAKSLYEVNEAGKYGSWESLNDEDKKWQDEDIFQLSRNINVGFFASVVLKDYVAAILNTPRANSSWWLDLGAEIKESGKRVERGTGNVVSIEFAVLYKWHAALSAADDRWMESLLRKYLPELKSVDEMTIELFQKLYMLAGHDLMSKPAKEWTFGGLQRNAEGRFDDIQLAEVIKDCIEEPAHAFGANGTPASLKMVDILGQIQARDAFNVCTMNEFRKYLNLKPYESFEEWNEDKVTARAAELLYSHIDNLELYPGLMAECTKPAMPGSGVCPGQTTGRGILDDAVALVRGDRFLTHDFNSTTLTNWGFAKLQSAPGKGNYGGVLTTLLYEGIPGAWGGTSSYVQFPFYTPKAIKETLTNNKIADQYDFARPPSGMDVVGVYTQAACKQIFTDRDTFAVMYQNVITECTGGHEFMIGWDQAGKHDPRSNILHKVFFDNIFENKVYKFFSENVSKLIKQSSLKYSDSRRSIDIVRDVTNVTPILWLAEKFAIPLKTQDHPRGLITRPQLFNIYLVLFMYQSFNIIPENEWNLRKSARELAPVLRNILEAHLKTQRGAKEKIVDWLEKGTAFEVGPEADRLYHALNETKFSIGDLVGDCIGMGAPIAGNLTQQASLLIDLYLKPEYVQYKERIVQLAQKNDAASRKEMEGWVFEGMRHAGVVPGLPRVATKDVTIDDGPHGPVHIKAGHTVLVATSRAAMDPVAFPNPEKLDPTRPASSYTLLGHGLHFCFGARLVGCSLAATLMEVFKLKNLRRAPGSQGHFSVVHHELAGVQMSVYLDDHAKETPIPTSLTLQYDE
ncbi:9,12-octadecadienoate 8-hydroperoxide 8R-isomerase [Hyphodiscus hymeniophilus]|uniref:9,12-octadecadienoate 8-hydroperoxide 8R-isomerase n=1 Tax=Hyphodiscus hymeniophilus TaxID=353542 RepID=A0A9P6VP76_9HELO|nr:9,12-octadecadienoate 8-hydroperoxide 8R-isomerase [Hyphodiscus hymeniophilus]